MDTEQQTTQVPPPQEVISKLSRLSTLLADVKRVASEYWEVYHLQVDIGISGTNCFRNLSIQCDNYAIEFSTDNVYLFLKSPDGGRRILQNGKGSVGDILTVPLQCWEKLISALENLIREKVNKIDYMRRFYYTYKTTA